MARQEPRAQLTCPACAHPFSASARYARQIRAGVYEGLCPACKHPKQQAEIRVTYRYRRWWLDRFSREEILEMGAALEAYLGDLEMRSAA